MNKTITISEEQAKLVMQCLDLACKQGGLNAAAAILPVAQAIESQLTAVPAPAESFGVPSVSFEQASAEAVAGLQAGQNPET